VCSADKNRFAPRRGAIGSGTSAPLSLTPADLTRCELSRGGSWPATSDSPEPLRGEMDRSLLCWIRASSRSDL
jgi:hypothetical protein